MSIWNSPMIGFWLPRTPSLSSSSTKFNGYRVYVERDVRQFANIRNLIAFETFLKLLAGRVGQIVILSDLSSSTGVSATTLSQWLVILEASFIVFCLPPYFENFGKRLVKSPKVYFVEPGLATYLLSSAHERLIPFEIKASGTFSPEFCKSFPQLKALSPRIEDGIVIYSGDEEHESRSSPVVNFIHTGGALKNLTDQ